MTSTIGLEIKKIREEYAASKAERDSFNLLVYGEMGTGKTHLLTTARRPILIHSFDPGGTKIPIVQKGVEEGWILVQTFENESVTSPTEYKKWAASFETQLKSDFLSHFATYAIDSATTWIDAMMNQITKHRKREEGLPAIQDYLLAIMRVKDIIKQCTSGIPCDFIMTGHITRDKDEVTGRMITKLNVFKGLKVALPILFDEVYMAQTKAIPTGAEYHLLTRPQGDYDAKSRLGTGILDLHEKPNIKDILKKLGRNAEDMPKL